jgi:hypothetical protein
MELIEYKNHFITYQRQGNDINGNPIYLVNIFVLYKNCYQNVNFGEFHKTKRIDKHGNIRIKSYNIEQDIKDMIGE